MKARATMLGWVLLAGCIGRSLPLPPPGASIQSVTQCPMSECPDGGLIVTVGGMDAQPGATVIAQDTNAPLGPGGDLLGAVAQAHPMTGVWSLTITPRVGVGGVIRAVQYGHIIRVFQVSVDGEASQSTNVTVFRR